MPNARSGTTFPAPTIVTEAEIRAAVTMETAIQSARRAFVATAEGRAIAPPSWSLDLPDRQGEAHVKGAYLQGSEIFAIKAATGFELNSAIGLPYSSGFSTVFDATTGALRALLLDNAYLTDLRTGAAGALSVDMFAAPEICTATIVGTGSQARFQIEGLLAVRTPMRILVSGRNRERAEAVAAWARTLTDVEISSGFGIEDAVRAADLVITATTSPTPVVLGAWVRAGTHITAVGSDAPWKRELDQALLSAADLVVVDDLEQARRLGELKGVADAQLRRPPITLGDVLTGAEAGRTSADDVTVVGLSGLGAQDTSIAEAVLAKL